MFRKPLKTLKQRQRGAMFGLDARIAMAIMAGLSIIAGASMVQILKDRRVDALLFEQEKFTSAVAAIQEDLQTNVHDSLTTSSNSNAVRALFNDSVLTATAQNRWLGPYLREGVYNSINHKEYGVYELAIREDAINQTCTAAEIRNRDCYYWLLITEVPLTTINNANEKVDGAAEATPQTEGIIQWDNLTATDGWLWMRLGLVAP